MAHSLPDCTSLVPWERLWSQIDKEKNERSSDTGFLESWNDIFGVASPDEPKQLTELLGLRCLILCGEPGMGKSKTLELLRPQITKKANQVGELYWRSFREALSPDYLLNDLKESAQWKKWINGSELTIVIDGVDEGLALASSLISVLVADLRDQPVTRLRLVLVCRDAEWPVEEGRALLKLWPDDEVGRFRLQRLRQSDAEEAARQWGLSTADVAEFMIAVKDAAVEAFAARPMTLSMLVEEFRATRRLSGTRTAIFRRACLRLCRQDPDRTRFLKTANKFKFTAEQIMTVVERVAAVMLLCRYNAISDSHQHLNFEKLIPTTANEEDRAKVEAAVGCALFSDAGNQSRAFAHQAYAEFLAAEYLSNLPLAQVLDLICVRVDEKRPIVPQLSELAAWLALRHSDFADWVIKQEPEILLRNDASVLTAAQRELLVAGLLTRLEREEVFEDWDFGRFYGSFQNPKLAEQLKKYLRDPKANRSARLAAIQLAYLSKLGETIDDLLAIAKSNEPDLELREQAFRAVCRLIPTHRLVELEPFAKGEAGSDPYDELRGAALKALVPARWRVSEAMPQLTKPSKQNFFGVFHEVCERYLPEKLDVEDLVLVLRELTKSTYPFNSYNNRISAIANRALILACCNLTNANIATELLTFVTTKLRAQQLPCGIHEPEWKERVEDNVIIRRQLTSLLIGATGATADDISRLQVRHFIPLKMDDCPWYIQQVESAVGAARALWALLARMFWPDVIGTIYRDDFMDACAKLPELGEVILRPCIIQLDSVHAKEMRELWGEQKLREDQARSRPRKLSIGELFNRALAAARADWRRWRELVLELLRDDDTGEITRVKIDCTDSYLGKEFKDVEKEEIVGCAREFLVNAIPSDLTMQRNEEFGFEVTCALWLAQRQLTVDVPLREAVATKWFESLFAQPCCGAQEEQILTLLAVELDAARSADCLRKRLQRTISGQLGLANVLLGFELCWRAQFTRVLVEFVESVRLTGPNLSVAIRFLARHEEAAARSWLTDKLKLTNANDLATCVALGLALFPGEFWQTTKSIIENDAALAIASLQAVADVFTSSIDFLNGLEVDQLGDMFLFLEVTYPSGRPLKLKPDEVSKRESIERLRSFVPKRLQTIGSRDACDQLLRLAAVIPHQSALLRRHLRDTQIAALRKAWLGVPLEVLAELVEKNEWRWVRSKDDLLELVMESIRRFQHDLNHTDYPSVPDLWNEKPSISPKDEIALTEKLVRWLSNDLGPKNGAALGCQVEPSRVHETDIEVWAQPGGSAPTGQRFLITIEVKRSFNQEVGTSLEKQLVAEYLIKLGRTHGIYLVGWYKGAGWKPNHNPLKAQTWAEANDALTLLLARSRANHSNLRIEVFCLNCEFPQAFRNRS